VGPTIKRAFVEGIVRRGNDLKADLIAITGDLVGGSVQQLSAHTAPLAGLTARIILIPRAAIPRRRSMAHQLMPKQKSCRLINRV
jgi:hypothetical protein